jgi:hypothetical protein
MIATLDMYITKSLKQTLLPLKPGDHFMLGPQAKQLC